MNSKQPNRPAQTSGKSPPQVFVWMTFCLSVYLINNPRMFNGAIVDLAKEAYTSNKKFHFNEFVANVLRDVIGIVIFDLRDHGGC